MAIFCSFSSLDDLKPRDWRDYEKVKATALKAGRFSCFEINTRLQASQIERLKNDPEIVMDSVNTRFPWTSVRRALTPDDFQPEQTA
jgi:hypothetical protein